MDIAAGAFHSIVLTKAENSSQTKVMTFGHPLASGFEDNIAKYLPTEVIFEDIKENIAGVYAGQMRSGAVSKSGRVFVWGEWFTGSKQFKPQELGFTRSQSVAKLSIGKMFLIALTKLGKVYTIGDNTYGELGISRDIKHSPNLIEIPTFQGIQVIDIAAGARHALVLTNENKLFSFGDNSEGQCGIEIERSYIPVELKIKTILNNSTPEKIFCGEAHSSLITNEGELFTWGDNTAGRLGIKGSMSVYRPRIVEDVMGKYISKIGCGGLFTVVLVGPSNNSILETKSDVEMLLPFN